MLGYAGRGLQEQNDLRRLGRGLSSSDGNALFSALIIFSKYPGALLVIMEWRRRARRKMRETRRSNCWELLDFPQGKRNPAAGVQLCWLDATNGPSILTQSYVVFLFFFYLHCFCLFSFIITELWKHIWHLFFFCSASIGSWLNNEALLIEMNNKLAKHLKLLHL